MNSFSILYSTLEEIYQSWPFGRTHLICVPALIYSFPGKRVRIIFFYMNSISVSVPEKFFAASKLMIVSYVFRCNLSLISIL